jgi:hypothetical protein
MDLDLVAVLSGISGGVLIWCSLKNKHPIEVVKLALTGGDPNAAKPFTSFNEPAAAGPSGPGVFDPNGPLVGPGGPLEEYRNYDPNAPGLGGMPVI